MKSTLLTSNFYPNHDPLCRASPRSADVQCTQGKMQGGPSVPGTPTVIVLHQQDALQDGQQSRESGESPLGGVSTVRLHPASSNYIKLLVKTSIDQLVKTTLTNWTRSQLEEHAILSTSEPGEAMSGEWIPLKLEKPGIFCMPDICKLLLECQVSLLSLGLSSHFQTKSTGGNSS